jgi:hypothetical protein
MAIGHKVTDNTPGATRPRATIAFDAPDAAFTFPFGINNRGQIVGAYENPDATPDGEQSPMQMPMMMSAGDG